MTRKTVVVTGASRGIGYQTALKFASEGHQVLALARSKEKLDALCQEGGESITAEAVDLSDAAQIATFCKKISAAGTRIEFIVHNAGLLINKPFMELTDRDWHDMLEANLLSGVRLIRELGASLNSPAHIVLIGSMGGFQGSSKFPGLSAYSSSKAALAVLAECLATELAASDIRVNCLCLGAVQTEMLAQAFPGFKAPVSAGEMGEFLYDFTVNGSRFFNGKILPVSLSDPDS
ncbi:MAG: SDR family NAD(P)-dependent oxidoreductase [Cyclonatronaceae bacterium]